MSSRLVLEIDKRQVMVRTNWMELLESIRRRGRLADACKDVGTSYRSGLNWVWALEKAVGGRVVESSRGGRAGGSTILTDLGRKLLESYYVAKSTVRPGLATALLESRMSARNLLRGRIKEVRGDGIISLVTVGLEPDQDAKAIITTESVKRLGLKPGDNVYVVVKATDALILK